MNNRIALKIFTESLAELVSEDLTLYQSLRIIGESKLTAPKVRKSAEYIAGEIASGSLFSNALQTCPFMDFDKTYISFAAFSEETGNLKSTMKFLDERCKRQDENISALKNALVYPVFVISLTIALFGAFIFSGGNFWGEGGLFGISKFDAMRKIGFSFLATGIASVALVAFFKKNIGENKVYEAFLSGGFLVKEGVNMSVAVGMAAMVAGIDSKIGEVFEKAKERIEIGMDVRTAFCGSNQLESNEKIGGIGELKSFGKGSGSLFGSALKNPFGFLSDKNLSRNLMEEIERSLCFAEETGNKDDVLLKIASRIKKSDDKNRKICLMMVEPSFIVVLGVFLLSIVFQIVLPVFSGFGTI